MGGAGGRPAGRAPWRERDEAKRRRWRGTRERSRRERGESKYKREREREQPSGAEHCPNALYTIYMCVCVCVREQASTVLCVCFDTIHIRSLRMHTSTLDCTLVPCNKIL